MVNMLTVEEVADMLKIKKTKAYQLVGTPGFPSIKLGRTIRIPEDELEKWIKRYVGKEFGM